jgi:hypothetical protein
MNERDKELAEQAGLVRALNQPFDFAQEKFTALIRADEREKFCAVLRQLHDSYSLTSNSNSIRARLKDEK